MATIDASFRSKYGPWAVVAGASVGLGAAFARQLAENGLNVVLVARRVGPLEECARALAKEYDVEVRAVPLDLGAADMLTSLREHTRNLDVGLLVYNAALGLVGRFLEQDIAQKLEMVDINCRGPLILADEFGRSMAARGRGGIILMSSLAGQQGAALIATYAASKAFDLVLGEGLWDELREHGVDVLSFCAGATRTPNYEESQPRRRGRFPPVMEAEPVVTEALAALGQGPSAVAGLGNRVASFLMKRLLPRRFAVETMGRQTRAMYAK